MQIKELGHVVLYVTNLDRSVHFYRDVLGFKQISQADGAAVFSSGRTHHELLLIEIGGSPRTHRYPEPGLYHIGFKIGDTPEDLVRAYHELKTQNVELIGTSDHGVTHSLYLLDPDGNELELYADISNEWKTNPHAIMQPTKHLRIGPESASA